MIMRLHTKKTTITNIKQTKTNKQTNKKTKKPNRQAYDYMVMKILETNPHIINYTNMILKIPRTNI